MPPAQVRRVRLRSYRSIDSCDVELSQLTFLVGPNGSGKSNFLDALRLVSDSLNGSLDQALRSRGGIERVVFSSPARDSFRVALSLVTAGGDAVDYDFRVANLDRHGFVIKEEMCRVHGPAGDAAWFEVKDRHVESDQPVLPRTSGDRLYLVTAASLPVFRPVFDTLASMAFYSLNPEVIRSPQEPDVGDLLARDGRNLASVVDRLDRDSPDRKQIVEEYLSAVVPGVVGVRRTSIGPSETLRFTQEVSGGGRRTEFWAQSMSDGTLRALGVLVAAFQPGGGVSPTLIGIEEPELAVHPAAAAVLREALGEASESRQVVVTSHSPDLLDDPDIKPDSVLAVRAVGGGTVIGKLDAAGRMALQERLYTAGELLRLDQLTPDDDQEPAGGKATR